ncbi:helix-turn-helix domain-containing protein [Streptomyces sp. NBC_01007]|nr:helix-turn-helix domain-containing protein [Streptomyces sp. NBC_01007]
MPSWDARWGESVSSQDDVEEFAALLRRLKARTDRSYAALARRLNMNASTLHRYCAGEAVPLGFAPVERFAALCEASPAERIELHRRWILAVAARQRSRTAAESVPQAAGARSAGGEGTVADSATELVSAVAGDSVSTTAAGSVPTATPDPSPGHPRENPAESLHGSSPEPDAASHPASRKPWYRRRVTVTAAAVTALIATLGSLSALPSDHSGTTGDDRASGTNTARSVGARGGSATPSAPPSTARGRSSGTPSPKASGERDASPGPSASPSPMAGSAVTPITWTANSHRWATGCFHDYVIDKAPEEVPPPPAPQDASPWARTQNAVHGGQTFVDITVQGRTDAAVVLEALRVRVVGHSAPVKGRVYSTGQGCGADLAPHSFAVDLDMDRPIARAVPGNDAGTITPPLQMPYRVSVADPEVLTVDARTDGCDCRWYLELDWSSQGRTGTERIDDDGVPFRTSGIKGLPHYWYAHDGWTPA